MSSSGRGGGDGGRGWYWGSRPAKPAHPVVLAKQSTLGKLVPARRVDVPRDSFQSVLLAAISAVRAELVPKDAPLFVPKKVSSLPFTDKDHEVRWRTPSSTSPSKRTDRDRGGRTGSGTVMYPFDRQPLASGGGGGRGRRGRGRGRGRRGDRGRGRGKPSSSSTATSSSSPLSPPGLDGDRRRRSRTIPWAELQRLDAERRRGKCEHVLELIQSEIERDIGRERLLMSASEGDRDVIQARIAMERAEAADWTMQTLQNHNLVSSAVLSDYLRTVIDESTALGGGEGDPTPTPTTTTTTTTPTRPTVSKLSVPRHHGYAQALGPNPGVSDSTRSAPSVMGGRLVRLPSHRSASSVLSPGSVSQRSTQSGFSPDVRLLSPPPASPSRSPAYRDRGRGGGGRTGARRRPMSHTPKRGPSKQRSKGSGVVWSPPSIIAPTDTYTTPSASSLVGSEYTGTGGGGGGGGGGRGVLTSPVQTSPPMMGVGGLGGRRPAGGKGGAGAGAGAGSGGGGGGGGGTEGDWNIWSFPDPRLSEFEKVATGATKRT